MGTLQGGVWEGGIPLQLGFGLCPQKPADVQNIKAIYVKRIPSCNCYISRYRDITNVNKNKGLGLCNSKFQCNIEKNIIQVIVNCLAIIFT